MPAVSADDRLPDRAADVPDEGAAAIGRCTPPGQALAESFLVKGKPYCFGASSRCWTNSLYPGWGKLVEAIHTNRPTTWDPATQKSLFDGEDSAMLELFWEAMHSLSTFTARALGEAIDFSSYERLLDVGGGSGAYDIELCKRYPQPSADKG